GALGPATSPRKRSGAPRCACSQAAWTTGGSSDPAKEALQHARELVRPLEARQVAATLEDAAVAVTGGLGVRARVLDRDERVAVADRDQRRRVERGPDAGEVGAVADRLDRRDQVVRLLLEGERP